MLGRKKKREIEKDESEENGLHKNESLLEYKNKSLCTLINDLRTKLKSKEESYSSLESKFNSIISFFNLFTTSINTLNQEITSALSKNKISINENIISKEEKNIFSSPSEFIQSLLKNEKEEKKEKNEKITNKDHTHSQTSLVNTSLNNKIIVDDEEDEEMKDVTEKENEYEPIINLNKNTELLINKLLPILKLNKDQYEKMFSNVDEEIASKNKEQEETIKDLNKTLNNYKAEIESLKTQNHLYQSQIDELQEKLEKLNEENFKLHRKINTHPLMPLLVVEGQCLDKPVEEHKCVCIVCDKTFNAENQNGNNKEGNNETNNNNQNENSGNDNKNTDNKNTEMKNEHNSNNIQNNGKENEVLDELSKENEALRKRIRELHENLEEISGTNEITEENILGSKIFQSLISQAETILSKLEKMKEINNDLQREYNSVNQKKENEILQISNSYKEQLEKCSQKLLESAKIIEKNKSNIQILMNKIESLENLLKEKEAFNMNMIYDAFKKERDNLMKKIEVIKTQKKDYLNKYDDECLKNQTHELTICRLKNELNNLRIIINTNKIEEKKLLQYELNKEAIKNEQEKAEIYKKENERLKFQLSKERQNTKNLEELNDMTQKSIFDLNSTIKNLKNKLDEEKENQSRLANEKIEAKQTISLLTEMKEVLDKKNQVFKEQIENYEIYTKKMEDELEMQKQLNSSLEDEQKLNEKDIEILKAKNIENLKTIEKEKVSKEDLQNKYNEIKNWKKKQLIDYDVLKAKYDDVCKLKQFDKNTINVEDLNEEYELLKKECQTFREMVHCKVCKTNMKNVVITKCFHTFCKGCIDAAIESRRRRCPICRAQISQNDVKEIFWD
jgi:E3 ubiquitin-protein ligase BRE1